jgi:hypothetical protein
LYDVSSTIIKEHPMNPYTYINAIFEAKAAKTGGIVRRKIENVERYASRSYLLTEVAARRFHLVEVGSQYLIICNSGSMRLIC